MTSHSSDRSPRVQVLLPIQYLRGIAALMVVWHHARTQVPAFSEFLPAAGGASGVDLFFVISGFIMQVTCSGVGQTSWQFFQKRVIRVVPLYWALTLLMVAVWALKPSMFKTLQVSAETLLLSLLFVPHFSLSFPSHPWPLLVPGWTLNYEMFFYAIFGASIFLRPNWRVAFVVLNLVILALSGWVLGPFDSAIAQVFTSQMMLEFASGILIALCWQRGVLRLPYVLSLVCAGSGFLILLTGAGRALGVWSPLIAASLMVIGVLNVRVLSWRNDWLRILGDSSYSLYLTHLFSLGVLRIIWGGLFPTTPVLIDAILFMVVALLFCSAIGVIVYRFLETPITVNLRAWMKQGAITG